MSMMGPFWSLSTSFLSGAGAAGGIALINTVANLGGFLSPNVMGQLKESHRQLRRGRADDGGDAGDGRHPGPQRPARPGGGSGRG